MASKRDIGALRTPCENHLLFANKLSSYCFFADLFGAGHIPRVLWALLKMSKGTKHVEAKFEHRPHSTRCSTTQGREAEEESDEKRDK